MQRDRLLTACRDRRIVAQCFRARIRQKRDRAGETTATPMTPTSTRPEQGQMVSVRTRHRVANDILAGNPPEATRFDPPDRLDLVSRSRWAGCSGKLAKNLEAIEMRYRADITAGSLKLTESRLIADLLLRGTDAAGWREAIVTRNVLQANNPATARRLARLIRSRLEPMGPDLWKLVRDGEGPVAMQALFAAAVKQSPLLGDFLTIVVGEQRRRFGTALAIQMFDDYLEGCRERDPDMPQWRESTRRRVRSSVFQMLAQAGYVESTRSLALQTVHVADRVLRCLEANGEEYVLRCMQVAP